MTSQGTPTPSRFEGQGAALYEQLEAYPWDSDPEFQSGLQAILGQDPSPDQAQHLTLRARCFYFSRKNNIPVDFNAYQTWRSQRANSSLPNGTSSTAPISNSTAPSIVSSGSGQAARNETNATTTSSEPPAPYPTSFSQIVELITNGQPIPGIQEVPDTVLEGQASQATTTKRKKPWEADDAEGAETGRTIINA
ncbi:hypothetical protein OEA41_009322 [Lepraria neglecta]|uniref:Uncharacterized protein n=1 Tax=Lepraria neglecta TaxID=209136 RepID=A0AAD9Z3D0_9LECA|nr:hypothetical protein OEA41_009322 [Lepraria neglecta]